MKHVFDSTLRADPDRLALAERAARQLDEMGRWTVFPSTVAWRRPGAHEDQFVSPGTSRSLVEVELRDDRDTVHIAQIRERDVGSEPEFKYCVARLWGDFLEERAFIRFKKLRQPHAEIEASSA